MERTSARLSVSAMLTVAALVFACDDGELRGSVRASEDGETYLAIVDDNGGHCGGLKVDGKPWPHPIGAASRVEPGKHVVGCGNDGGMEISIPAGMVYSFDYWGP